MSFAMLRTWMKTSSVGMTRPSGCWDVEPIVEAGGSCEKSADGRLFASHRSRIDKISPTSRLFFMSSGSIHARSLFQWGVDLCKINTGSVPNYSSEPSSKTVVIVMIFSPAFDCTSPYSSPSLSPWPHNDPGGDQPCDRLPPIAVALIPLPRSSCACHTFKSLLLTNIPPA